MPVHTYRKFDPVSDRIEVAGAAITPILNNQNVRQFDDLIHALGFDHVDERAWYPLGMQMEFLWELSNRMNSMQNMVAIGMEVGNTVEFPRGVKDLETGMAKLNHVFRAYTRNMPDDMGFVTKKEGKRHLHITDNTPYPHDFVYGFLYGISRRLLPNGVAFKVEREYMNNNAPDDAGGYYAITWEK